MAAATSTFSSYDRSSSPESGNPNLSTQTRRFNINTNSTPPRPGQHLDDADLLAWKRQYANIGLREQNIMSNSADDLSQLVDRIPYQFEVFGQDYNDPDDDEIHFDNGNNYDYDVAIQERLKRANEEFQHDETPVELKHRQRVSFDANVKAVDIVQDPQEYGNTDPLAKPPVSPVSEELPSTPNNDDNPHQYTVPLNDTQPKSGPTLTEQLRAFQFHGGVLPGERWSSINSNSTPNSSIREDDLSSSKLNSHNNTDTNDTSDMTIKSSSSSQKSMVVSINGEFQIQDENDYTAKRLLNGHQTKFNNNDEKKPSTTNTKVTYTPTPPTQAKPKQDPLKPQPPTRPYPSLTRPKSSDSGNRSNFLSKSLTDNHDKSKNQQRPTSAGVSKSIETFTYKPSRSVDFDELNRKAAERKRAEQREEERKKQEALEKRKIELAKAQESFEKWVRDKDAERKRLIEEKRLEKEEQELREAHCEKELKELREKKYQEWVERKNQEVMLANQFKKLQEQEEGTASGGSSSSIHYDRERQNRIAYKRWIRHKDEQSKEERRQLRLEARRLRRRQRRSIKRFQLQQDLQLAKSFGYS